MLNLYTREGCHLCEQFLLELALDGHGPESGLQIFDVDANADLAARYGLRVPVLERDGQVICEGGYERQRVLTALRV